MKTAFLMTALTVLLVLIGDYFGGLQGMIVMLSFSVIMNFYAYWNSDKMVLRHYNAREVDAQSAPALYKMVQDYYNYCPVGHVPRRRPQRRRGQQRRQLYRYSADYDSGTYCCGLNSNGCIPLPRIYG